MRFAPEPEKTMWAILGEGTLAVKPLYNWVAERE